MSRRRVESNGAFDENDRSLYRVFKNTANLVSQFYAQSVNSQKLAFEAGETYAILEMQEWMLGKMREGKIITVADILGYLKGKMDLLDGMTGQAAAGHAGMATPSSAGMAAPSSAVMAAPSSAGMAAPLFPPQEQSSYPDCSFGPLDQNSAELAARLFAPEEWSPAPQEQGAYPDMQIDRIQECDAPVGKERKPSLYKGDNENELVMKEKIFMRVLFCKIHCPFMCFCKPAAAHLYNSRQLKLENTPQIVVSDTAVCSNSSAEVKIERVDETNSVLKSCMRKLPNSTKEVDKKNKKKKKVQWMDDSGKQLAEIKVFESSETGDTDNEEESTRCLCVIL